MSEFRDMPLETCEFQFVHEDTVRRALEMMPAEDQLYDLAELSRQPLEAEQMTEFIRRSMEIVDIAAQM